MRNYCALGDSRYLPNLICLIDSAKEHFTEDYMLHVLAMDDFTFNKLNSLRKHDNLKIYSINEINEDFQVRAIRYMQPSREAISNAQASNKDPGFVQFCWSLAPCFSDWLMTRIKTAITYIDADIYFFNDIKSFFDELSTRSIGLVSHRIPYLMTSGEFNVGIVHFEYDSYGRSALNKWKSYLTNSQNNYMLGFGTCGDQKYLELFYSFYRNQTAVIDKNFGHLAPWNVTQHKYEDRKIIWKSQAQDLVYFHFAHFVIESENKYRASYNNEWIWGEPLSVHPFVNKCYDEYHSAMIKAKEEIAR
ncbi:MAG: hypothetical protein EBU08_01515 [Micrococcales bacterium]|jgi:hypothetical protein|nr:hypothetical protein [Micrococcales bacterium]